MNSSLYELLIASVPRAEFDLGVASGQAPYSQFLESASNELARQVSGMVSDFEAHLETSKPDSNRFRIVGSFNLAVRRMSFRIEMVWLPRLSVFRTEARVWMLPGDPTPKSISQFISEVDSAQSDNGMTWDQRAFLMVEGVDSCANDLPTAYPAIFRLFERFPEEDFGAPSRLIRLMETRGDYEQHLERSLVRKPSMAALIMVRRILAIPNPPPRMELWIPLLTKIANSQCSVQLCNFARRVIETPGLGSGQFSSLSPNRPDAAACDDGG